MAGACSCWALSSAIQNRRGSSQVREEPDRRLPAPKAVASALFLVARMMLLRSGDVESNPGPRDEVHPGLKHLHSLLDKAVQLISQIFSEETRHSSLSPSMVQAGASSLPRAGAELAETVMDLSTNFTELDSEDPNQLQGNFLIQLTSQGLHEDTHHSCLSPSMFQEGAELAETVMDLGMDFTELELEDPNQLQDDFLIQLTSQGLHRDTRQSYLSPSMIQAGAELAETVMDLRINFAELGSEDPNQLQNEFLAHVAQNSEVLHLFYRVPKTLFHSKSSNAHLGCF